MSLSIQVGFEKNTVFHPGDQILGTVAATGPIHNYKAKFEWSPVELIPGDGVRQQTASP